MQRHIVTTHYLLPQSSFPFYCFSLPLFLSLSISSALALPPDVLVESIGPSWITVNWTEPDNPFPSVRQYLIEYKLSFHSNWTQVTVPGLSVEYSITSLYPHALYHVRVSSVNELGVGEPSLTMSVMTLPGAPGSRAHPLTDSVQLDSNSSDSLTVTWTVPEVSQPPPPSLSLSLPLSLPFTLLPI